MLSVVQTIHEIKERLMSNAKLRLISESNLYLSQEKKAVLANLPLIENEKIKSLSIFRNDNYPIILGLVLTSICFDLLNTKNKVKINNLIRSTTLRMLAINCFYYFFLIDYDKFYSVIYYKQLKSI
jgi:hypothetical protein